ncbi:MAG: ABC transporter permease subunit [Thermoplasmatota archaeon]
MTIEKILQRVRDVVRLRIAFQTMKDFWKQSVIITLLFSAMFAMFAGMYPSFVDMLEEMQESGSWEQFMFLPGIEDMASYIGFLNMEMYQIFWMLILGLILGFLAASVISAEIESKTIDILMSNPVSKAQIVVEKFLGLLPMVLMINFVTMGILILVTIGIGETVNFSYLFLTHVLSLPYFFGIIALGILISVIINEKMKASIITMAILIGMFIFNSIANMIPDYGALGLVSLQRYFKPYDTLKLGQIDATANIVLLLFCIVCIIAAMIYFHHKDIIL